MVLHRSSCRTISAKTLAMRPDPFTSLSFIKVCADAEGELREWMQRKQIADFSKRCSWCKP